MNSSNERKVRDALDACGAVFLGALAGLLMYFVLPSQAQAVMPDAVRVNILGTKIPLIGRDLNGTHLNGCSLEGRQVISVSLDSVVSEGGESLSSLRLEKTLFHGVLQDGSPIGSMGMVGAEFMALLDDGGLLPLRIQSIERIQDDRANKEIRRYQVSYFDGEQDQPLCGLDEEGQPMAAIPVKGHWNLEEGVAGGGAYLPEASVFTFACEDFAVAKCVMAGYKPWKEYKVCSQGAGCVRETLSAHMQACTRLLRADFCGDGRSHTVDGTWVNVYDGLGVRIDADDWLAEAEWNAHGAVCMKRARLEGMLPDCAEFLLAEDCGLEEHFALGTLLMSEVQPDELQ